jgi:hypothetical protein
MKLDAKAIRHAAEDIPYEGSAHEPGAAR